MTETASVEDQLALVAAESEKVAEKPLVVTVTIDTIKTFGVEVKEKIKLAGVTKRGDQLYVSDRAALMADIDGVEQVRDFGKRIVKIRTTCQKEHKAIKDPHWKICTEIDASRRACEEAIKPIEDHLIALEKVYENELTLIQKELAEVKHKERLQVLCDMGGEPQLIQSSDAQIRMMDDDAFAKFIQYVQADIQRKKELAEQQERVRQEQAAEMERIRLQQAEIDRQKAEQQRVIDEQNAEIARQKKELDDMRALQQAEIDRQKAEAETERLAEQNRIREQQLELQRQQAETEKQRMAVEADKQAMESQRLLEEHERESAKIVEEHHEATKFVDTFAQYRELPAPKPHRPWHDKAGLEISNQIAAWIVTGQFPSEDEILEVVSDTIAKHDPD